MKNLLNSVMLFLLLFIGQNAWGQEVVASGNLVNDGSITWSVEQTGTDGYTLNITGSGEMPDYSGLKDMPWAQCKSSNGTTTDYCSKITELNIDSRITKIGRRSFFRISKITSITIPDNCVSIGVEAFRLCIGLKEIYIPSSVTSIGTDAFSNCRSLNLIHYDGRCDANTGIAFSNVAASGKIIEKSGTGDSYANVPEGWEYYTHGVRCNGGAWVAENADQTKLFFYAQNPGATVNYAGRKASGTSTSDSQYHPWRVNCMNYTSLEINKNIATIAASELIGYETNGLMYGYANIQNITVESGNENFVVGDEGALYNKAKTIVYLYPAKSTATEIEIPSTVTQVRPGAFLGAMNLKSITFLGTVKTIYAYVFAYARSLNKIYFASQTAPTTYYDTSFIGVPSTGVVFAGADTEAFQTLTTTIGSNWTFDGETYGPVKSYISDGTLYVVGKGAYTTSSSDADWYSQRSSIKKIVVKEGITDIGSNAFANCSNVTEATLNNNGNIDHSAFADCSALTRVNIGPRVTEFKAYIFYNSLYGVTTCYYPFSNCPKLSTINVTDLKAYCSISGLEYLTDSSYGTAEVKTLMVNGKTVGVNEILYLPEGMTSYNNYALRYFSNVQSVCLPSTMTTVSGFGAHKYLREVTLNNNGNIDNNAFADCSALTRVNIGPGVTEFTAYFNTYSGVTTSYYPFSNCPKLSTINVTDLKAYCSISGLEYLTDSSYGTAEEKTLLINGTKHDADTYLYLPESITSYSKDVLKYFSNVKKVCLSPKATSVTGFKNHTYLTDIILPASISYVEDNAFYGCTSLQRIVSLAENAPTASANIAENPSDVTLKFTYLGYSSYTNATYWKKFNLEQGTFKRYSWKYHLKTKSQGSLTGYVSENVVSWVSSDATLVNVDKGAFSTGDFTYDGSTATSNRDATVSALTEDANTYMFNVCVYPREVVLTDGNAYKNTVDFDAEKISYTRSFSKAGAWFALYLPFAIDIEAYKNDFDIAEIFTICPTTDTNGDGIVDASDSKKLILSRLNSGMTQPNAPYMIRTKAAKEYTIVSNNTTLASAEINEVEFATSRSQYTVKGIYDAGFYVKPGDNNYYMATSGSVSFATTKNVNIKPNRWFMHEEAKDYCGSSASNSASKFIIEVVGEDLDETTAIKLINGETVSGNGKSYSAYNINGMKVDASKNLPSGLYIINGKKVFKK